MPGGHPIGATAKVSWLGLLAARVLRASGQAGTVGVGLSPSSCCQVEAWRGPTRAEPKALIQPRDGMRQATGGHRGVALNKQGQGKVAL